MKKLKLIGAIMISALMFIGCEKEDVGIEDNFMAQNQRSSKSKATKNNKAYPIMWHWNGDIMSDCMPWGNNCPVVTPTSSVGMAMDDAAATGDYEALFDDFSNELEDVSDSLKVGLLENTHKMYPIDGDDGLRHYRIGVIGLD